MYNEAESFFLLFFDVVIIISNIYGSRNIYIYIFSVLDNHLNDLSVYLKNFFKEWFFFSSFFLFLINLNIFFLIIIKYLYFIPIYFYKVNFLGKVFRLIVSFFSLSLSIPIEFKIKFVYSRMRKDGGKLYNIDDVFSCFIE